MNYKYERKQITDTFKEIYGFKPVINIQQKKFKEQKAGWYLQLGISDKNKIYLGSSAGPAIETLTENQLDSDTLKQAEDYATEVAQRQAAQWTGTKRDNFYNRIRKQKGGL